MTALTRTDLFRIRILSGLGFTAILGTLGRLALLDFSAASQMFHPHGYCYLWQPDLVALHVIADGLIGVSYVAISGALIYLVWRARRLLPFSWVFVAFGVFIVACGATHFMEIWTLWSPLFWLSGDVKVVTAVASVATAVVLPPLVPKVVKILQDADLSEQRRIALEETHHELEQRVGDRTAQLKHALERAEDAARSKETFLSTVSHELRTPLNAILGWARMLNDPVSDEALIRRGLAVIDRNAGIQAQLIEDLLDVSRLGAGTMRLQMEPVDLVRVVADAVEVIRPAANAKQVTLSVSNDPERVPLMGDPRRLQQIVWNLLSNAVKFTPPGGRISIALARPDGSASVEVHDTGIGITAAFLPYLFDQFSQADGMPTRTHQGLGLGLAIARQLVELHGGTITAQSAGTGRGATFRVDLPLRSAIEVDTRAGEPRRTSAAADLSGVDVLLVDDEDDARETLSTMLTLKGASVTSVSSADAAYELLLARAFDVLLSDIGMPERDGYDLIRQIRRSPDDRVRNIPAIAVTAYAGQEDRDRVIATGFHLYVAKPVSPEELTGAVGSLLAR